MPQNSKYTPQILMRLAESVLLSISVAFFIIGVSQAMRNSFVGSYWVFMLSILCLLALRLVRAKTQPETQQETTTNPTNKKKKK